MDGLDSKAAADGQSMSAVGPGSGTLGSPGANRRRVPDMVRRSRAEVDQERERTGREAAEAKMEPHPRGGAEAMDTRLDASGLGPDDTLPRSFKSASQHTSQSEAGFSGPPPTPSSRGNRNGVRRDEFKDGSSGAATPGNSTLGGGGGGRGVHRTHANGHRPGVKPGVNQLVLKFTTLSDGNERASFYVDDGGGTIGRGEENTVSVPSDTTLAPVRHARIEYINGEFQLMDQSQEHHAAIRVGTGRAAPEWPLSVSAAFSAGNSIFVVEAVEAVDSADPLLTLSVRTGPKHGETLVITRRGATLGRANENTVCIQDRELSRRHSRIHFDPNNSTFLVSDLGSTNGTYVQLVGPYAGRYPLHLNDNILVGRTGFSINRYDFGKSEEKGLRREMEDKSILLQDLRILELEAVDPDYLSPQTWMAVYDGHGGIHASHYLSQRLHQFVKDSLNRKAPRMQPRDMGQQDAMVKEALKEAFLDADRDFISASDRGQASAGSTATSVLILGNRAYCANVGDSRTVLCRSGQATPLSMDHKPSRDDEAARIKAAGGFVINRRVMGELAVSRAFGDIEFKKCIREIVGDAAANAAGNGEDNPDIDTSKPLIVAEPEIQIVSLTENDDFLLLACDGLFDVLTNQKACDIAAEELARHGDAQKAAEALSYQAINVYQSRDNVTVMIVLLRPLKGSW